MKTSRRELIAALLAVPIVAALPPLPVGPLGPDLEIFTPAQLAALSRVGEEWAKSLQFDIDRSSYIQHFSDTILVIHD